MHLVDARYSFLPSLLPFFIFSLTKTRINLPNSAICFQTFILVGSLSCLYTYTWNRDKALPSFNFAAWYTGIQHCYSLLILYFLLLIFLSAFSVVGYMTKRWCSFTIYLFLNPFVTITKPSQPLLTKKVYIFGNHQVFLCHLISQHLCLQWDSEACRSLLLTFHAFFNKYFIETPRILEMCFSILFSITVQSFL